MFFDEAFAWDGRFWNALFDRANANRVTRRIQAAVRSGRCLEVGPGTGALLARLRTEGYDVQGLDISAHVATALAERLNIGVTVGTLDGVVDKMKDQFDVVVMRHVLEHMMDPAAALASVRRLLKPGGLLYVAVPNVLALEAILPGWTGYQPYHVHYFSPASLSQLLGRSGFERLTIQTREPFSGWPNAVVNTFRSKRGFDSSSRRVGSGVVYHLYNLARFLVGLAIWPLRTVQAVAGRGEELEVLART
jgi:SAM-dependent methyltransferase